MPGPLVLPALFLFGLMHGINRAMQPTPEEQRDIAMKNIQAFMSTLSGQQQAARQQSAQGMQYAQPPQVAPTTMPTVPSAQQLTTAPANVPRGPAAVPENIRAPAQTPPAQAPTAGSAAGPSLDWSINFDPMTGLPTSYKVSPNQAMRTARMDAEWTLDYSGTLERLQKQYSKDMSPTDIQLRAAEQVIRRRGRLPSSSVMNKLIPDWKDDREADFYFWQQRYENYGPFRKTVERITGLSGDLLDRAIRKFSVIWARDEVGGYVPNEFVQILTEPSTEGLPEDITLQLQKMGARPTSSALTEAETRAQAAETELAGGKRKAQIEAEYEMEPSKPISAEDRAKYGVGSTIPTYTDLANQGFRFPTEADRKVYRELSAVRDEFTGLEAMLFGTEKEGKKDGIFSGIGNDVGSRTLSKTWLFGEKSLGTKRGQNAQLYTDTINSMARRLLTLAGETGGRFTDVDVRQIVQSAPDIGDGLTELPDSEEVAKRKFDRLVVLLGKRLSAVVEGVAIKPMGQPGTSAGGEPTRIYKFDEKGNVKRIK
jgi:hypothetical protein